MKLALALLALLALAACVQVMGNNSAPINVTTMINTTATIPLAGTP